MAKVGRISVIPIVSLYRCKFDHQRPGLTLSAAECAIVTTTNAICTVHRISFSFSTEYCCRVGCLRVSINIRVHPQVGSVACVARASQVLAVVCTQCFSLRRSCLSRISSARTQPRCLLCQRPSQPSGRHKKHNVWHIASVCVARA